MNQAHKPVWFIFFVLVAMIAVVGISQTMGGRDLIPWRTDFAAAQQEARSANKPLFMYFGATWCAPCQSLKRTTWADRDVETALQGYIPVNIDIDEQRALAQQYAFSDGIPFFIVMTPEGKITKVFEGAIGPKDFLEWLKAPSALTAAATGG